MKRTALKRYARLQSRKPMRRRARKSIPTTPEDRARLNWLHDQPCAVTGKRPPVDVHHHTQHRGLGQKSKHDQGIPLAHDVHMDFHAGRGLFKGWMKDARREWQTAMVLRYQTLFAVDNS